MKETSYVMVKPEFANDYAIVVEIVHRLEANGLKIVEGGYIHYSIEDARKHYAVHVGKDFYPALEDYITSDYAYGMIVEGENAIAKIRALVGSTKNPEKGTIRYDIPKKLGWEIRVPQNVIHASDSVEAAEQEIEIFESIVKRDNVVL